MNRKFKVYKNESGKANPVLETGDYEEACRKEKELKKEGYKVFVWEC